MFVPIQPKRRRRLPGIPPGIAAAVAVFLVAIVSMGQTRPASPKPVMVAPAAPADAAAPDAAAPSTAPAQMDDTAPPGDALAKGRENIKFLWDLFLKGGSVMWVLAACSVLALAIIFERLYSLRRSRVIPSKFLPGLRSIMRSPRYDREAAIEYCRLDDSPLARMVSAFFKRLPRGFDAAEKALEDAGGNEALKLRQNLRMLYAIGSAATLLGLIGTIAGMISAFMVTARLGNADNKVEQLSSGIYAAMVCTFGGLAVAILVTIFYYYFVGKVEKLVGDINDELARFADEYGLRVESSDELDTTRGMPRAR